MLKGGLKLSGGTIVDATTIAAPSSTKNEDKARDPDMHQTKKGNGGIFGMKVHIGVDCANGLLHSASITAANMHDSPQLSNLLHGQKPRLYGDSAYRNRPLSDAETLTHRRKSPVRAKAWHVSRPLTPLWDFAKARYRGLIRKANRTFAMLALVNINKWGRPLTVQVRRA